MSAAAPAIAVQDVQFAYGERQALNGLTFSVNAGEIFGLLGPNGGGKSTLFRILSTLLPFNEAKQMSAGLTWRHSSPRCGKYWV